jgi:hypothetical protein
MSGRVIVVSYPQPTKTFEDIRAMLRELELDPSDTFFEACRRELQRLIPF